MTSGFCGEAERRWNSFRVADIQVAANDSFRVADDSPQNPLLPRHPVNCFASPDVPGLSNNFSRRPGSNSGRILIYAPAGRCAVDAAVPFNASLGTALLPGLLAACIATMPSDSLS